MNCFTRIKLIYKNLIKYLPLLECLVQRELKNKYRQNVLGYIWCVLSPLMVMLIMNFVFSHMFRNSIANFPVYLFVGRMFFTFITDSTQYACRSIVANGPLMRKTRIPNYIFTLASMLSSVVNFVFSLAAFAIVLLFTQTPLTIHVVMFPVIFLEMFLFCMGTGFFLAQANVFIRDTSFMYSVFITGWIYLTPLFYPIEALPATIQYWIGALNPAYCYIRMGRMIFLEGVWPHAGILLKGLLWSVGALAVGLFSYSRSKDKFILYV
ncbi:MAG: ABC transporter permease [Clostridia bacterium]|nr:ABC transporter permease [Clostridia bacterium]